MSDEKRRVEDPFELLSSLDPFAEDGGTAPDPEAKVALFKEITMPTTPTFKSSPDRASAPPTRQSPNDRLVGAAAGRDRSRFGFGPRIAAVAAAVVVIAAVAAITLLPSSTTPAAALVLAAEQTGEFDSGRLEMAIEVRSVGADPELDGTTQEIDYRFDGDDLRFEFRQVGPLGGAEIVVLDVAGAGYLSEQPGSFQLLEATGPEAVDSKQLIELFWGLDDEAPDPEPLVGLVAAADGLEQDSNNGLDRYRASILTAALVDELDRLPAGLGFLLSGEQPEAELPEALDVTVEVADGVISSISIGINGETAAAGEVDAGIRLDYSGLGEAQGIEAPPSDQIDG